MTRNLFSAFLMVFMVAMIFMLASSLPAQESEARGKVSFSARRDYPGLYTQWAQAADTNGYGIPDMLAVANGTMDVLLGNGDGTFAPTIISS